MVLLCEAFGTYSVAGRGKEGKDVCLNTFAGGLVKIRTIVRLVKVLYNKMSSEMLERLTGKHLLRRETNHIPYERFIIRPSVEAPL